MILCHKSNLVYTVVLPQFLIFQQNNSAQTSVLIFFTSRHYYFFDKFKIVEKQLCKLNCFQGKVSHTLKSISYQFKCWSLLLFLSSMFTEIFFENLKKKVVRSSIICNFWNICLTHTSQNVLKSHCNLWLVLVFSY